MDTNAPSPVHLQAQTLREELPAEIWVDLSRRDASDADAFAALAIPAGPVRIFNGFTSGVGFHSGDGIRFTVGLNHWLTRLNEASALNRSSHPMTPAFFAAGALNERLPATGVGAEITSVYNDLLDLGGIQHDLWGQALLPLLATLAREGGPWLDDPALPAGLGGPNVDVLAALALLAPGASPWSLPLALDPALEEFQGLAGHISDYLLGALSHRNNDGPALAHSTHWDLVAGRIASDFSFAVVPRVEDALVVPYVPGQRSPFLTIGADQYRPLQMAVATPRWLRAFGILPPVTSATGFDTVPDGGEGRTLGIGGFYDAGRDGTVLLAPAPGWLSTFVTGDVFGQRAAGGDGQAIRTATSPAAGTPTEARARKRAAAGPMRRILDRYARLRYAENVLQGRTGSITGALRLDVAPGTTVAVEVAPERRLGADDALAVPFYGTVLRHSIAIDAEAPGAGSTLLLGAIRNAAENEEDATSIDFHPLYTHAFVGAPLLDA
jgi:hypothetical protein